MSKRKTPAIEDPVKPASTAELRREGRLARIAKALVSGASVTDIAEAEGISRTLASREANSPECRQLVAEFVSDERDEMRALFYRSLHTIEHALSARREYMTKEGQIIYGGPDHYARLAATKHLRDFMSAGRPAPKQPKKQERRWITLQGLRFVHEFRPLGAAEIRQLLAQGWIPPGAHLPEQPWAAEAIAAIIRITGGNFRLLSRLLTQMERILEINELHEVTKAIVEAARETLVIGEA